MPKAVRNYTPRRIPRSRERWVKEMSTRLVLLRQWLGLSQAEMAARVGMTVRAYREYERGHRKWKDLSFTIRVSATTNVAIDWLRFGDWWGEPPSRAPIAVDGAPMRPVLRVVRGLGRNSPKKLMRRRGAPWTEAQIAYVVQLWVSGMTQAEIAVNYGYANSKIRIFSLRYAPGREDLDAKARAALALECWREKQKLPRHVAVNCTLLSVSD